MANLIESAALYGSDKEPFTLRYGFKF